MPLNKFFCLKVDCDECHHINKRNVQLREPEEFSKDGKQSVLSQYWCEKCGAIQVIRYEFKRLEDNNVIASLKHRIESNEFLVPKEMPSGITVRPRASRRNRRE